MCVILGVRFLLVEEEETWYSFCSQFGFRLHRLAGYVSYLSDAAGGIGRYVQLFSFVRTTGIFVSAD